MAGPKVGNNKKAGRAMMKKLEPEFEKLIKYIGATGDNSTKSYVGCLNLLNQQYYNGERVTSIYTKFRDATVPNMKSCLNSVDGQFASLSGRY